MTVGNIHSRFGVRIYPDGASDVLLGGIVDQDVQLGSEVRRERSSGDPYPRHIALTAQRPRATFTSFAIAKALDACGLLGLKIASTINAGLELFAQKFDEGSLVASGANHRKYTVRNGLLIPRTLRVDHQGDATISYEVLPRYDDTNAPIIEADSATLPSGLVDDERFTLGPFTVESVAIGQATQLEIDFGLAAETIGADSDIWDTFTRIGAVEPMIRIRGTDVTWLAAANIPRTGKAATHANTKLYLRKRAEGSTYVADGTAEHIKFTAAGLATIETANNQSGDAPTELELQLPLNYDGTNVQLVIDTTSTIV